MRINHFLAILVIGTLLLSLALGSVLDAAAQVLMSTPTAKPTIKATNTPAAKPTSTPTAKPTSKATDTPAAKFTSTPTVKPTNTPTTP